MLLLLDSDDLHLHISNSFLWIHYRIQISLELQIQLVGMQHNSRPNMQFFLVKIRVIILFLNYIIKKMLSKSYKYWKKKNQNKGIWKSRLKSHDTIWKTKNQQNCIKIKNTNIAIKKNIRNVQFSILTIFQSTKSCSASGNLFVMLCI